MMDGDNFKEESTSTLIEKQPRVISHRFENIVVKPIFNTHCMSLRKKLSKELPK